MILLSLTAATGSSPTDVWVCVGNQLVSSTGQLTVPDAKYLTGIHGYYEDGQLILLATDIGKRGAALYRIQGQNSTKIYEDASTTYFEGVVYSPSSGSIYLTSPSTHSIIRISEGGEASTVYQNSSKVPSGLAIDVCTSTVYWTNTGRRGATIEEWLDTDQPTIKPRVLVSSGLNRPRGISVDLRTRSLYWTDQERNKFGIWRSGLAGEDPIEVARGKGGEPFGVGVSEDWIYWTDWSRHASWRIHKQDKSRQAELVREFKGAKPNGIAYLPSNPVSCDTSANPPKSSTEIPESTTTVKEIEFEDTAVVHPAYTNQFSIGQDDSGRKSFNCSSNILCVHGEVEEEDCLCEEGWTGPYCEVSVCHNYCLAGGECRVVEGHPLCLCSNNSRGDRCEEGGEQVEGCPATVSGLSSSTLLIVLPVVCSFQLVIITALALAFYRYTKKPRIVRKRFVSVTREPKKSKKREGGCSGGLPVEDGIQLDIENCCNMKMCDTPCFDPPSRVPKDIYSPAKSATSPGKSGRSDKQSLLDNTYDDDDIY